MANFLMLEMNSRLVCKVIGDLWCNKSKLWKEVLMHKMCSGTSVGTDFQPGCCGVLGAGGGPCSATRKSFVDEGVCSLCAYSTDGDRGTWTNRWMSN